MQPFVLKVFRNPRNLDNVLSLRMNSDVTCQTEVINSWCLSDITFPHPCPSEMTSHVHCHRANFTKGRSYKWNVTNNVTSLHL